MEKPGSRAVRINRNEKKGDRSHEYIQASLQGKWIALAVLWIEDNAPCKTFDYLKSVSLLMPPHILQGGKRANKMSLAKEALRRIMRGQSRLVCVIEDDIIHIVEKKSQSKYGWEMLYAEDIASGKPIDTKPHRTSGKKHHAIKSWLRKQGYHSTGNGIYALKNQ